MNFVLLNISFPECRLFIHLKLEEICSDSGSVGNRRGYVCMFWSTVEYETGYARRETNLGVSVEDFGMHLQ